MENRYRVALILKGQGIKSGNFNTKDEAENFILEYMDKGEVTQYRILDKETGNIIETEKGKRK